MDAKGTLQPWLHFVDAAGEMHALFARWSWVQAGIVDMLLSIRGQSESLKGSDIRADVPARSNKRDGYIPN